MSIATKHGDKGEYPRAIKLFQRVDVLRHAPPYVRRVHEGLPRAGIPAAASLHVQSSACAKECSGALSTIQQFQGLDLLGQVPPHVSGVVERFHREAT